MKKLSLGVAAGLVAVASAVGVGLARPSQAVAHQYRVVEMKELARFKNLTVVAMNDKADVVANAYLGGRSVIIVALAADTLSPRVIIFRTPKGFTSVSASGIDAEGTIAATATRAGGWSVPYVGYSPSNGHTEQRLDGLQERARSGRPRRFSP
jgi:hypothetical protein